MTKKFHNKLSDVEHNAEEAIEILEQLPEKQRQLLLQKIALQSYSGPVMPPEYAEHYEAIIPGAAGRILDIFEKQAFHRMELEAKALDAQIEESKLQKKLENKSLDDQIDGIIAENRRMNRSVIGAFFLVFTIICLGCTMAYLGYEKLGMVAFGLIGLTGFASLVGNIIIKKQND